MVERERKVDVNMMSAEEVDVLSVQLGDKIRAICEDAAAKANAILNIYGANCKIAIAFDKLPDKMAESLKPKKKAGRSSKNSNLKST